MDTPPKCIIDGINFLYEKREYNGTKQWRCSKCKEWVDDTTDVNHPGFEYVRKDQHETYLDLYPACESCAKNDKTFVKLERRSCGILLSL